jgi:hypothetical protein
MHKLTGEYCFHTLRYKFQWQFVILLLNHAKSKRCDTKLQCMDRSDEDNCRHVNTQYLTVMPFFVYMFKSVENALYQVKIAWREYFCVFKSQMTRPENHTFCHLTCHALHLWIANKS